MTNTKVVMICNFIGYEKLKSPLLSGPLIEGGIEMYNPDFCV